MRWLSFLGNVTLHVALISVHPGVDSSKTVYNDISPEAKQAALNSVTDSVNSFAGNFYKVVANRETAGNLICSPISTSIVLSMLSFGARSSTRDKLRQTLALSNDSEALTVGFQSLTDRLNEYKGVELLLANKIFLSDNFNTIEPRFNEDVETAFRSRLQLLNFAESQSSSKNINNWVEDNTKKHIKNIIQPDDVDKNTALVLVNAVYFKGEWATKFNSAATFPFWVDGTTKENRTTMYSKGYYKYGELEEVDARFIELPYKSKGENNDTISMFIILPNKNDGLKKLEENFNKISVQKLVKDRYDNSEINVYLPKFKIEKEINLEEPLRQLGLADMFTEKADFTGIASGRQLQVSQIKQKAFVEINEEGSEGGAATALLSALPLSLQWTPIFRANHPFMAIIATTGNNPVNLFTLRYTGKE